MSTNAKGETVSFLDYYAPKEKMHAIGTAEDIRPAPFETRRLPIAEFKNPAICVIVKGYRDFANRLFPWLVSRHNNYFF